MPSYPHTAHYNAGFYLVLLHHWAVKEQVDIFHVKCLSVILLACSKDFWEFKGRFCITSWWTFSFWSACIPTRDGEKAWNLSGGGLWSRNIPFAVPRIICTKFGQIVNLWKMICRLLAAKDSNHVERVSLWKEGRNTHFPAVMGTGCARLIIGLSGCFLPSFSVHRTPLHLLTLRNWGRGMCGGEEQRNLRWTREKNQQVGWGLREISGEKTSLKQWQAEGDGQRQKETSLKRLRQKTASL